MALPEDPALRIVTDAQFDAHADRHAADGPDPMTPEMIGALNGTSVQLPGAWGDMDANLMTDAARYALFGGTSKNLPPQAIGFLDVIPRDSAGSSVWQFFHNINTGTEWSRSRFGQEGEWSAWKQLVADDDPRLRDTGWRVLSSWGTDAVVTGQPLPANITPTLAKAGSVRIRRVGRDVTWSFRGCEWSAPARLDVPGGNDGGFGAGGNYQTILVVSGAGLDTAKLGGSSIYDFGLAGWVGDPSYAVTTTYPTDSAWPAEPYPGDPA